MGVSLLPSEAWTPGAYSASVEGTCARSVYPSLTAISGASATTGSSCNAVSADAVSGTNVPARSWSHPLATRRLRNTLTLGRNRLIIWYNLSRHTNKCAGTTMAPVVHSCQCSRLGQPSQRCPVQQQVRPWYHNQFGHFAVAQKLQPLSGNALHQRQVHNEVLSQFNRQQSFRKMKDTVGRLIGECVRHGGKLGRMPRWTMPLLRLLSTSE